MRTLFTLLALSASLSAVPDENRLLFEAKCAICHALPDPESLGEKQWQAVLKTMQKRMREAGRAELNADEFAKIHCYLSGNQGRACHAAESK